MTRSRSAPAGEQDLALKVALRRAFWGMNYATRLNLKLALPGRMSSEELTDLDCVAFSTGADFSVRTLIADCKSGSRVSPAARAFWLAGVREYFGADRSYLVIERDIPTSVRELAGRLGIDVLGAHDRQILENVHSPHAHPAPFFEIDGVVRLQTLARGLDKRLDPLLRFGDHDYWTLPEERRLQRLIVELRGAAPVLDARNKAHQLIVVDLLFLFALALLGACRFVSAVSLADPRETLLTYLLGGPEQIRSRRIQLGQFEEALKQLRVETEIAGALTIEPEYFDELAETVARLLRRPRDTQRILRYLEWWAQAQIGNGSPSVVDSLGPTYGDFTRKLVADIARMCFTAAGLGRDWVDLATTAGNGSATGADAPPGSSVAGSSSPSEGVQEEDEVSSPQLRLN